MHEHTGPVLWPESWKIIWPPCRAYRLTTLTHSTQRNTLFCTQSDIALIMPSSIFTSTLPLISTLLSYDFHSLTFTVTRANHTHLRTWHTRRAANYDDGFSKTLLHWITHWTAWQVLTSITPWNVILKHEWLNSNQRRRRKSGKKSGHRKK